MINIVDDHVNVVYIDIVRFSFSICFVRTFGGTCGILGLGDWGESTRWSRSMWGDSF